MDTFLSRALDLSASENAELPDDVDAGNLHADAVAAVVEEAIALGKADGSLGPNEPVRPGQIVSFLDRGLDDLVAQAGGELPEDAKGNVHEKAIEAVTDNGITQGFVDGTFRPGDDLKRRPASPTVAVRSAGSHKEGPGRRIARTDHWPSARRSRNADSGEPASPE